MRPNRIHRVVYGTLIALGLLGASTAAVTPPAAHAGNLDGVSAPVTGTFQQPRGTRVRDHRDNAPLPGHGCDVTVAQGGVTVSINAQAIVQVCPH